MSDSTKRAEAVRGLIGMSMILATLTFGLNPALKPLHAPQWVGDTIYVAMLLLSTWLFATWDGFGVRSLNPGSVWNRRDGLWMVALALFYYAFSSVCLHLLRSFLPKPSEALVETYGYYKALSPVVFGVVAIGQALLTGASEELVFRSYLITRLRNTGLPMWPSILISALFFGLLHWPDYGLLLAIEKGVTWGIPAGYFFCRRGSILPLIVAHSFINALGTTFVYMAVHHSHVR